MVDTTHHSDGFNTEGKYIPKSYQFERDMDYESPYKRHDTIVFSEDSNAHYVYHDKDGLVNTNEGKAFLKDTINNFYTSQVERLNVLEGYSQGKNANILHGRRRLEGHKADYRASHNWGGYISNFITGYVISKPVKVGYKNSTDDEGTNDILDVAQVNRINNADTLNFELGYDTSRYGRAFELHYRQDNQDRFVLINPQEMFVIRDTTVDKGIIAAVYLPIYNGKLHLSIYTESEIIKYKPCDPSHPTLEEADELYKDGVMIAPRQQHFYNMVPVVEWWNNRFRTGDFESVLSSIDLYDAAQSDTANYMSDLNDAMLVIAGDLESAGLTAEDAIKMKDANMLLLESGIGHNGNQTQITADYIYKQYDVNGTEAYKQRLLNDIYKLSLVPNLDDDRFYSGQSGVALQYKLIGLEQLRATKESLYTRALKRRYTLIQNIHEAVGDDPIDAESLTFTFDQNMPKDTWLEIQQYITAGGYISQETLREHATFTDNKREEERLQREALGEQASDAEIEFTRRFGRVEDDPETD